MSSALWFSMNLSKIWSEGTREWLNHSFNQKGGVCGCVICVSFVLQEPSWTVIVSTTNVGLRRSCWDAVFTTSDWSWFLTPTRHSLVNCCLFLSTRSTWSHLMGAAWLISWQRPPWSYTINWCHVSRCCRPKQLMSILSTCHSACIQQQGYALSWLQWAQHSALLAVLRSSTETHSEISGYTDSAWTEGGMTPASDEIVTNPASANELCFLQIHVSLCMTKDEFVWLWMGPQESKGVYKLVPVVSQIFLLTVAQLFCPSLTSRSQVTLSMVTLLLISQWLRHLFRWVNASASDYCIISSPLLQLYMLQRVCEERGALFLFFDWRSSVTKPIEDCTRRSLTCRRSWTTCLSSRVCSNTGKSWASLSLSSFHAWIFPLSGFHAWIFPLSGFHAWIFLSQVFITGTTVNLTQDDVVLNSVVKSKCDRTLEEKNTAKGELFVMTWFISAQTGGTLFSFFW
jgi:hypothetical protein